MSVTLQHILRYPIKGLSAESLSSAALTPGSALAGDRRFGLRHAASAFDPAAPTWQDKNEFIMLARTAELAQIASALDLTTGTLKLSRAGQQIFVGNVFTAEGRNAAASALNAALNDLRGSLSLVDAGTIHLTDYHVPCVSLINLATLREMAARFQSPIEPERVRGNLIIDGLEPWAEFDWVGKTLHIGTAQLKVFKRIGRCAATTVNPQSAQRDVNVPKLLQQHYAHTDCGIYASVSVAGIISVNDAVSVA